MTHIKLKGFTLVELIMTIAIIGLLAMVTLPLAELSVQHSKEQELRLALREIRSAIDAYKQAVDDGRIIRSAEKSGYPEALQILVDGMPDAKNPSDQNNIYFLRRIPRDPMETDTNKSDEDTWGKRSYQSSADDPQEGDDVYDVYSLSTGTGLNGVPYKNW
ncbi:MAG: type II secretion system protein [Gallionella sp.]|nr:type II secretion system protein [Gallionella sp.]